MEDKTDKARIVETEEEKMKNEKMKIARIIREKKEGKFDRN